MNIHENDENGLFSARVTSLCITVSIKYRKSDIVRAVTFKVIVVFPYNLVQIFTMMRRRVTYKTNDSVSKVKVTVEVKGHNIVILP